MSGRQKVLIMLLIVLALQSTVGGVVFAQKFSLPNFALSLPSATWRLYKEPPTLGRFEVGGFVVGLALIPLDSMVYDHVRSWPIGEKQGLWKLLSFIGDPRLHIGVAGLLAISGHENGEELLYSLWYNGLNTMAVKSLTGMSRPNGSAQPVFSGPSFDGTNAAMPSGHTSSSFTVATVLGERNKKYEKTLYAIASLVGLSRIMTEKHWPSNVLIGGALGHMAAKHVLATEEK